MSEKTFEGLRQELKVLLTDAADPNKGTMDCLIAFVEWTENFPPVMERFWQAVNGMEHDSQPGGKGACKLLRCDRCALERIGGQR